jgi:IS30 family transposase
MIDKFSRWVELVPIKSTDAKSAAQAIIAVMGRYGDIAKLTSDNGPEFSNNIVDEVVRIYRLVSPKRPKFASPHKNAPACP